MNRKRKVTASKGWAVILPVFFLTTFIAAKACATMQTETSHVDLYIKGKKTSLSLSKPEVQQIVQSCEEQLQQADDILRLAVSSEAIEDIKQGETALEILYGSPKTFVIGFNKNTVEVDRLLIPLTGDFAAAGQMTTIFLGKGKYMAGPYRNKQGTSAIQLILEQMGFSFK